MGAIEAEKDMTLEEFRNWFEETYGSPLSLIATAGTNPVTIYNDFLDDDLIDQRSNVKLSKLVKDISGYEEIELAGKKYMMLTVDIDEESDDESSDIATTVKRASHPMKSLSLTFGFGFDRGVGKLNNTILE